MNEKTIKLIAKAKAYRVVCGNLVYKSIWATCAKSAVQAAIRDWTIEGYELKHPIISKEIK